MPKPFRRATDGASKSPAMAEKHRASTCRLLLLRQVDAAPGAPFLWLLSLGAKESDPRVSAEWFGAAKRIKETGGTDLLGMRDEAAFPTYGL